MAQVPTPSTQGAFLNHVKSVLASNLQPWEYDEEFQVGSRVVFIRHVNTGNHFRIEYICDRYRVHSPTDADAANWLARCLNGSKRSDSGEAV